MEIHEFLTKLVAARSCPLASNALIALHEELISVDAATDLLLKLTEAPIVDKPMRYPKHKKIKRGLSKVSTGSKESHLIRNFQNPHVDGIPPERQKREIRKTKKLYKRARSKMLRKDAKQELNENWFYNNGSPDENN